MPRSLPPVVLDDGRIHPFYLTPVALHDNELLHASAANVERLEHAKDLWASLVAEVLCKGFYGEASLHLIVDDGTIQRCETRTHRRRRR